jgi:microsomal dipeptidase-like Zn-dependent dipeptidase
VADAIGRVGFTHAELEGILGGNFLRVFRRVWESGRQENQA